MSVSFNRFAALSALALFASQAPANAASGAQSPFDDFVGRWTGAGEITASDGHHEAIRCRADEATEKDGAALDQTIVCASDSYKFDITSYVEASGDALQGTWSEATRQISGHLSGQIADNQFQGRIVGQSFTAGIVLSSDGRRQGLDIKPSGGDISEVQVEFQRQG